MPSVEFFDDPAAFLAAGEEYLAARPVESNVVTVYADRDAREGIPPAPFHWYALVRDGERVVGGAMRTAPFEPCPLFVLPMPEEAALLLAGELHRRGEHPGGANGALPAARIFAEESARLWSGRVEAARDTRLWVLGELREPTGVAGSGRFAANPDAEVCRRWYNDFDRAAREQAGNADRGQHGVVHTAEQIQQRIESRRILVWEAGGEVVHLTGISYPVLGVGRIGPVYTPDEHRGHGYASACVAEASQVVRDAGGPGSAVCLFTDVDNPVSNKIYAALGYEPLVDMADHTLVPG
jgi:GNAT superfamily N-acetyltransferase